MGLDTKKGIVVRDEFDIDPYRAENLVLSA